MAMPMSMSNYYNYLKNGEWKTRPELPGNIEVLLREWNNGRNFGRVFTTSSVYLNSLLKQRSVQNRANGGVKRQQSPTPQQQVTSKTSADNSRISVIPAALLTNDSTIIQISVMVFCLTNVKDSFKRDLIFCMLENRITFNDIQSMLNAFADHNVLRENVASEVGKLQYRPETVKSMVRILLETSDILRDKSYAKLAMTVDGNIYTAQLLDSTYGKPNSTNTTHYIKNVAPYEPLFSRYISYCVAPKHQTETRIKLYKQFAVNRYDIVVNAINELPPFVQTTTSKKTPGTRLDSFDDNTTYYVYESKVNFMKLLGYSEYPHNGKNYMVLTYNDCIFDVLGDTLFGKTWQERLDEIPGPAKIRLEKRTGEELNNYKANNCMLGVSWLENDKIMFKIHTPPKRTDTPSTTISTTVSSTTDMSGDQTDDDSDIIKKRPKIT
uniref:GrBNV_gp83-like protein n=1 Tax=Nilaparvata lugens endogenous nudivirus TaxID=1487700 RepID=X5GE73_9VIRU|nr:GrBNV_gp83-like protein [Nilaparvata lugens endogenous nudivirus]